mmetsp:Transcript_24133/g.23182  ORF Transcript_24133/g.23182 Transcript_24133/m.23182 type:complete len:210 (-) Transcript_24133:292-921(-)|eukprot:CAMPEP_0197832746 /NCGR_PEP_ID=MMETSP1437-20131217/15934_1 /TAXON_ID=49252 ORGANISM="Eucampia antarctica, Strain CCMP1452" /NCGR_SAMPLE_ID=MMETSP1437 /ASSEMBLY_ACC=CAM_ASM_001096 /LENGTH=209 /DNA_ID=CAMNT_0043436299 /DNA_START=33 /DNA_END=662 /DNA_ORIENTATION=-
MAKLSLALTATLAASAAAFAPSNVSVRQSTSLNDAEIWDPMGLYNLEGAADTFPNMFPKQQFIDEAEIKHGRQAMLAWTGIWATHQGGFGLGLHIDGMPECSDWTQAFGATFKEQPALAGAIIAFIAIAEGESVGHSGDNWRNMSTKTEAGFSNYDPLGIRNKVSEEKYEHYRDIEKKNGRAAMIAMASLFSFESIPGSVPLMDLFGAQ